MHVKIHDRRGRIIRLRRDGFGAVRRVEVEAQLEHSSGILPAAMKKYAMTFGGDYRALLAGT
jgi:hypothetical protein